MRPQLGSHNPRKSKKKLKKSRRSASRRPPRRRARNLRARYKRATHPQFVKCFSLLSLAELPIPLRCFLDLRPTPKTRFRSWYRPRSPGPIRRFLARLKADQANPPPLFQLALYLIDFSPLRPLLLQQTMISSARGGDPFDPLSLLLVCLWKIASGLPWTTVAGQLADPDNNALWRRLFGFFDHDTPNESTLRAFRECLPDGLLNYIQKLFLAALGQLTLLPPTEKTHGYLIVGDGQRHQARSRHRCHHAVASCYQPTSAKKPRPCPARKKSQGKYSCDCDTPACQGRCALAPHLDRQARYSVYDRQKEQPEGAQAQAPGQSKGRAKDGLWGYRSLASRLVDTRFHHAWNVYSDCLSANADEGARFPAHMAATHANLPHKHIGYAIYDAACGEKPCLDAVYDLGGIPLFDISRDASDEDDARCKERGYDEHGHLLCHLGFAMTYQGIDRNRKQSRARWVCLHACRKSPQGEVRDCPYLQNKKGQHRYLERAFPDGSYRLARLVPHGTRSWKKLTAWRNTSEGRNASLENKGLKRFPDYGLLHGTFLVIAADIVENLCTLARLVYEATLRDDRFRALEEPHPRWRVLIHSTPAASSEEENEVMVEVVAIG